MRLALLLAQATDDETIRYQRDMSGLLRGIAILFFIAAGLVILWIIIRWAVSSAIRDSKPKRSSSRGNRDVADALSRIQKE